MFKKLKKKESTCSQITCASSNKANLLMKSNKLLYVLPAIALMACSKDSYEEIQESEVIQPIDLSENDGLTEIANPDSQGSVSDVYFAGQRLAVENFQDVYLYEGDILLSPDMVSKEPVKLVYEEGEVPPAQKSVGRTSGRWPNNTVYYAIDSKLTDQQRVIDAIKHWEAKTNLTFVKRSSESNYIFFTPGSGCSSYVGMIGGKQTLILSTSCTTGNTIHEIGHAIGLWHEQSRVDREKHIKINFENIQSGREHNFQTYQQQGFDGDEFTSYLDFGSIMMYSAYSFSKNGLPTITKVDGKTYSVQRTSLSSGDVEGINSMYPASSSGTEEPQYINGEFYTIAGLTVLRFYDDWFYIGPYGTRAVYLKDGIWYYR